jgi:hypothetical protein
MVNYDVILNLISIVLLLIILFVILFGCRGRRERFTNKEDNDEETTPKKEVKDNKPSLSNFENKVLNELSNGTLSTEAFTDLIKKEKFTQENLNNVINYMEYSKGVI